jgi:hypothetical protein
MWELTSGFELIDEWNAEVLFLLVRFRPSPLGFLMLYVCIRSLDLVPQTYFLLFGCLRPLAGIGSKSVFSQCSKAPLRGQAIAQPHG